MSTLELAGVTRSFGPLRAVDGVDLTVPSGSITAVLGPSGCGKTSLLRLVAGFLAPDAGTIAFDGEVVATAGHSVPAQRRRVGYVPQEGALFPHLDVAANIAFGLPRAERGGPLRRRTTARRVGELLELVELPAGVASRRPHELSGGQQQRVALARALAPNPAVVLLDEPFSSLDASLRTSTGRAVVHALRAAGATAVLVTHDQDEALSLADQVAVMRAGRLVQAASPEQLYRAPADAEVARFVGGAAVLSAVVERAVASCALGRLPLAGPHADGAAEVLVRPEQLRLDAPSGADGGREFGRELGRGPGRVLGRVEEVSFYGHDAAVRVRIEPDGPVVVARTRGLEAPPASSTVAVTVDGPVLALPVTEGS